MRSAADRFFVDTHVLLYSIDVSSPVKYARSREWMTALWDTSLGRLSWQVLNEFYSNATGKMKASPGRVRDNVNTLSLWQPVRFDLPLLQRAWYWVDHASISYWDALILAAAEASGCKYLLTEDLQAGRKFGDLTVVNPFLASPADFDFK